MGFVSGVITGIAIAAAAAVWYMSRSGRSFRDQYQLEDRLGELGDRLESSSRDLQQSVAAQLDEMRSGGKDVAETASDAVGSAADATANRLDDASASAAEVAAAAEAEAESATKRIRKATSTD
jgi:gas vesicle protein